MSELIDKCGAIAEDSVTWISRCFSRAIEVRIFSIALTRDLSFLKSMKRTEFGAISEKHKTTEQFAQLCTLYSRGLAAPVCIRGR